MYKENINSCTFLLTHLTSLEMWMDHEVLSPITLYGTQKKCMHKMICITKYGEFFNASNNSTNKKKHCVL